VSAPEPELRAAVVGASGYVGGELLRLLAAHPAVASLRAFSTSHAGRAWEDVHPSLANGVAGVFEAADVARAAHENDVLFLALPHGRSQLHVDDLFAGEARLIVDTAADFRIADRRLYEAYYGDHAAFEHAETFAYGLADVCGEELRGCERIAAPGCFATAALLALYPFTRAGLLAGTPVAFAVTGSSGAGTEPRRSTHHPVRAHSFFAYSLEGHRHEAEVAAQIRRWSGDPDASCMVVTHSAPLVRGIHASVRIALREPLPQPAALVGETYAGKPFLRVLERPPELAAVVGTNFAHLHAVPRDGGREALVLVAIDNLVKGGAGQAVQAMNLALGLPETAGLTFPGLFPC
jgi:[amino group carrier protein]-6-phospho-L-2-aminoadipate/5-phospho-L-glutamate reductase